MSLTQDSIFEACYKCHTSVSIADAVKCGTCEAPYHKQCADEFDDAVKWACYKCRGTRKTPSNKSNSICSRKGSSCSSKSSTSSSRIHLQLKLLEEKQKLFEEQCREKELQLKEKHKLQNEIMDSKLSLLQESLVEQIVEVEDVEQTKNKVASWLDENEHRENDQIQVTQDQIRKLPSANEKPQHSSTTIQINRNVGTYPVINVSGNEAEISNAIDSVAPQRLPSSTTFISKQHIDPTTFIASERQPIDSSVIAARHVIGKKLPEFNGDPLKWPGFLSQYEFTTRICQLTNAENLQRLSESLKGDAFKSVESLLFIPDNVPTIIEILRKVFGRPEYVINSILESIRSEQRPKFEVFDTLIAFSLQVTNLCATVKACSMTDHLCNPLLLQELVDKLPSQLKFDWALHSTSVSPVNLEVFNAWLEKRATSLTSVLTKPPQLSKSLKTTKGYVNLHSRTGAGSSCIICLENCEEVPKCPKFCEAPYSVKWKTVKDHNLCRICLKGHQGRCYSGKKCGIENCPYKHHTLLHKHLEANNEVPDVNEAPEVPEHLNVHNSVSSSTLFKVVPVNLYGTNNKSVSTYAFLDEGSSVTLLDNLIAEELQLEGTAGPLCLRWTKDQTVTDFNSKKVSVIIESCSTSKRFRLGNVRTVQNLSLPRQSMDVEILSSRYPHLKNIPIKSFFDVEPRILIGLDNAHLCTTNKTKIGEYHEPIAAKTSLGWSIYGCLSERADMQYSLHLCECNELSTALKGFIDSDSLEVKDIHKMSKLDQKVINSMERSLVFSGGRYSCGLLWRYEKIDLPESYPMAKQRSDCLLKRLLKDPALHKILDDKIEDYEVKGYVRKLSNAEVISHGNDHWYLPVFPVVNPNKPGKIRLVWDAAAKSQNISLNDVLNKGPDLLNSLPGILLRFREKRIGLAGDIMEMFHQIGILESEQQYHWFLWQKQNEVSPSKYAMAVLSFGAACSPCISQLVKNYHATKYMNVYPNAATAIQRNVYVDDWLDSFDNEEEALSTCSEVYKILSSGGFKMRNWISNSELIIKRMGDMSNSTKKISEGESQMEKVLGMFWDTATDTFLFTLKFNKGNGDILTGKQLPTKREVLRILMSIYDPLGLIAHITVFSKILLQKVWQAKIQWDDEIPNQLGAHWNIWISMLSEIQSIRIPRWYNRELQNVEYELHTFVDGSEQAYAAVSYIRCIEGETVICQLASAKTRTAPLKPMSIPRLELQSAVLGSRLAKFISESSNLKFLKRVFWTDSKTVMCWLKSEPKKFKQFVSFRIGEILELSQTEDWKWVPTNLNPADIATRMKATTDEINNVWYNGPSFLYSLKEENEQHLEDASQVDVVNSELELRPQHLLQHEEVHHLVTFENFSSYKKLRRRYYFLIRCFLDWKEKALKLPKISTDSQKIYEIAEATLFREAQKDAYGNEITSLLNNTPLEKSSPIFKLSPYLDEQKVLRTKGRIDYAPDALQDTKRPILMPPTHPVSRLIIDHYHKIYKHRNHETVINEVRQRFSISRLRVELKKVVNMCQHCKNLKATPTVPEMSPLPPARLSSFTRPFTFSGIDYFGPVTVIIGRRNEKRWCLLATCLTVRSIHIELVNSLTTSSCILGLRNFINRRGRPKEIYCDNGTNFRGASRELREAIENISTDQICNEFVDYEIKWCFNPPSSPHMGGSWERLVRSVKSNLQSITSAKSFHEEVLRSFLIEVENIINSRPLTYIPIENENCEAITPNHFLLGTSSGNKPIGEFSDHALILRNNWSTSQRLSNIFWQRWLKEYLPTLVRRTKWFHPCKPVEVGDIVIIFEDNLPRSCYPKGKVIDIATGRDGNVRKVTVKTVKGISVRPVAKVAVLDIMNKGVANEMQHGGGEMLQYDPDLTKND